MASRSANHRSGAVVAVIRIASTVLVAYGLLAFLLVVSLAPQSDNESLAHGDLGFVLLTLALAGIGAAVAALVLARRRSLAISLAAAAAALLGFGTLLLFV